MGKIKNNKNCLRGFTLIELLIVIAIIGLLSTAAVVSMKGSRENARDVRRLADLKQIKTALEVYYEKHGCFPMVTTNNSLRSTLATPCPAGDSGLAGNGCAGVKNYWNTSLQVLVDEKLLSKLPTDPINETVGTQDYCYNYARVKPSASGISCGGSLRTDFAFSVSFSTEKMNPSLPVSNWTGYYDYCVVGDKIY